MASDLSERAQTGTIETDIPSRLDRLPWARFHWMIVLGLGTAWILDGLEVNVIGSISGRLGEHGAGAGLTLGQISGWGASLYIAGACVGALVFGQLTDRFGRKRLFMLTLTLYLLGTLLTAASFSPGWFFAVRFITGMGIGGEYSAINSAIDELIPSHHRGRVDVSINGSYWVGGIGGPLLAILMLNTNIFPADLGWRLSFVLGAVIGLGVLLVRRNVPESPRWLFIHGREQEAEKIVKQIEQQVEESTGEKLPAPEGEPLVVHQRDTIPLPTIIRSVTSMYPRRTILGLALFIGQAFLYNSVIFGFANLLSVYFHTPSGNVPYYLVVFGAGNFAGALLLAPLFDIVGRKPMIAGTYILSGALLIVTGLLFKQHQLDASTFTACLCVVFFFASAGASAAYLTVSEIFPMETRALCIAVFYAVGTGIGGVIGPQVFSRMINTDSYEQVFLALGLGAVMMIIGGLAELLFGVRAERRGLESIARPLTAAGPLSASSPAGPFSANGSGGGTRPTSATAVP
jgi:MFS family permease